MLLPLLHCHLNGICRGWWCNKANSVQVFGSGPSKEHFICGKYEMKYTNLFKLLKDDLNYQSAKFLLVVFNCLLAPFEYPSNTIAHAIYRFSLFFFHIFPCWGVQLLAITKLCFTINCSPFCNSTLFVGPNAKKFAYSLHRNRCGVLEYKSFVCKLAILFMYNILLRIFSNSTYQSFFL